MKDKPPTVPLSEAVAHSINASEALQDTTGRRRDGPGWICENCLKIFEGVGFDQIFFPLAHRSQNMLLVVISIEGLLVDHSAVL